MVNHQRGGCDQKDRQNDQADVHLESPRRYIFHRMKSNLSPILLNLTTILRSATWAGSVSDFVLHAAKRKCLRHFRDGLIPPNGPESRSVGRTYSGFGCLIGIEILAFSAAWHKGASVYRRQRACSRGFPGSQCITILPTQRRASSLGPPDPTRLAGA